MPIVNENDAIASNEIRYGDNDRLAALIAHNIGAAVLVLLTDLDGLYTADPRADPAAALVARVSADDPLLAIRAERTGSERGSGGMASKLEAARIASWSGVRTVIANAARPGVLAGAVADEAVGTSFEAHRRKLAARKLWIAFAARVAGSVTVDDGARKALVERHTSLLPAGVVDVAGRFGEGDTVDVRRHRRDPVRPRDGLRRGRAAAQGGRPPHQRPPAGHGPRGHPPRRPRPAPRLTPSEGFAAPEGFGDARTGARRKPRMPRPAAARPGLLGGLLHLRRGRGRCRALQARARRAAR